MGWAEAYGEWSVSGVAAPEMKHFYSRVGSGDAGFGIADADFSLSIGEQLQSAKARR